MPLSKLLKVAGSISQSNANSFNVKPASSLLLIPAIKEGAKEFLEKLSENFELKIFTSRPMKITAEWLIDNNLSQYISDITNIKLPSYLLIDDRTICHNGNYTETLENINNFHVYWKS